MRWAPFVFLVVVAPLFSSACKPKPDPVCRAAQAKIAACPGAHWTDEKVSECVHDVRKASNAQTLAACVDLPDCEAARACIATTLTAAARK